MSKTELNQELSSAKANADYLLKTEDDIITGILSLEQGGVLNAHIQDLQGHLYTVADIIGITGEADPNAKIYTSINYIANGDSRKVAIEKLDTQAKLNADNISSNLVLIGTNAASIADILASIGAINGICPLDANAKIDTIYLPDILLVYKGIWDASTNTPTLADGTGELNWWYRVNVAGTIDLGSGPLTYAVGDKAVHNGTIWEKWDTNDEVISVNTKTGAVILDKTDIGLTNVTDDAQLKRSANDFSSFPLKAAPVANDLILLEDSENVGIKVYADISTLLNGGGGGALPAGTIVPFAGPIGNIPIDFLLCDGSTINRNDFSDLFATLGEAWGEGDAATTFEIPDLRGRFMRGQDHAAGNDPNAATRTAIQVGGNTGDNVGSLQADEVKSHNHTMWISSGGTYGTIAASSRNFRSTTSGSVNFAAGGSESRPKNAYVNYIIKF
jgi:microcystin-dependent protein